MTEEGQKTSRMFFALWPTAKVRSALDRAGKKLLTVCGGRRTRAETIHITLVFLGDVVVDRIEELKAQAALVEASAFELNITRLGWWRHNRVAWATPEETPEALTELVANLSSRLKEAGFHFDERPYVPHATLLRKANCHEKMPEIDPILWGNKEFVLVQSVVSEKGSTYEVVGRWPLKSVAK
ncbi:RNA 2',3'-cyclic phosphodiesterase [Sulfurirhabdus autotrophica]|uniref:RNA 2',3'-cyclic phosphodiesterase n=1 Tax=Sulfurirhabdus autotrophica TaxID=1706046 RepID=A0A4R3YEV1_9PROT|nr:RNA 2',3'-cyclic phosphodiesterase [Sulfurirhabdus autotrophica]TCV90707.1 2'-5' RNA ligase [Sulfurirhabdus autotrophica]